MHDHDHDRGLAYDLATLRAKRAHRRELLKWAAGIGSLGLLSAACSSSTEDCPTIPEETAGPFPGDGSNGPNALALSGVVRSDLRSSIEGASGVAEGIELTLTLTVVTGGDACTPLAGYAVYLWHCDRDGDYSMYSGGASEENYLRGVQVTDDSGNVTFTTIFPGCYDGRWPHMHFEVYPSADVSSADAKIATSQIAMPADFCEEAYAADGYSASAQNLSQTSLDSDNVFSDDSAELQLLAMSGTVSEGYAGTLTISVET